MFWRFGGYQSIPTISSLLDKPNVTVEEVLDEADLLQELKENNTKLIEYLRDDEVLKRLLDYIVSAPLIDEDDEFEPEEGDAVKSEDQTGKNEKTQDRSADQDSPASRKRDSTDQPSVSLSPEMTQDELEEAERSRLKYAYMASEVLSAPTWSVIEAMTLHETALRDFWHFLWRDAPLSAVQTNYFVKVNEVLLDKKPVEMVSFIMSLEGIVDETLRHVDNPLVMDLLLKVISLDRVNGGLGVAEWLHSHDLIPILLSFLTPGYTSSTQTSAGEFLKALITISANAALNEQPCIGPNSLTRQLVSEPCVQTLISCILRGGNPLTVAVGVVIEIIRKNNPDYDPESIGSRDSPPTVHDPIYLGTLLHMFASHVPDFMELILSPNCTEIKDGGYKRVKRTPLNTAWGEGVESLGFDRFKICELMAELLHCSNMGLHNEAGSHEFMTHRDAERERLRAEGAFVVRPEGDSGYVYPEGASDAANGGSPSFLGSESPDEIRRFDNAPAGDEGGFEDVSPGGVFVENPRGNVQRPQETNVTQSGIGAFTPVSKLGLDEDLVDEPLTPPRTDEPSSTDHLREADGSKILRPSHVEPPSPTALVTEQVEDCNINQSTSEASGVCFTGPTGTETQPHASGTVQDPMTVDTEASPSFATGDVAAASPEKEGSDDKQDDALQHARQTEAARSAPEATPTEITGDFEPTDDQVRDGTGGQPVVGDYLKIMFYEHKAIPTIFSFFFRFAWNNFLHHVVYDVVQQILNGPTEEGFNRNLVIDLFETGQITTQIVDGQRRSEEAESKHKMRMGYMGHLTLIAEEVVRFTERQPPEELAPNVMEKVLHPDWVDYVEHTLSETRERESAILGGVKPDVSMCHRQAVLNAISNNQDFTGSSALANAGLNGGMSNSAFEGFDFMNQGSASSGTFGFSGFGAGGSSLLSGFGGSSDDDEDEDMEDPEEGTDRKAHQFTETEGVSAENVGAAFFDDVDMTDS